MHFEGILKGYLKVVATGLTGPVAGSSSIQKGEGNRNRGLVQIGLVGSGFRSLLVYVTGPLNTKSTWIPGRMTRILWGSVKSSIAVPLRMLAQKDHMIGKTCIHSKRTDFCVH